MAGHIRWPIRIACLIAGANGAMAQVPATLGERDPSDPGQVVPATTYQPVTSGLQSFRPVDPLPWGSQNEKVAPKPKTDEESPAARQ
jgi:hypothetical protein